MLGYLWPVGLVVLSNVLYHICEKSMPEKVNPLASVAVTYMVGAIVAVALFFLLNPGHSLLREWKQLNWTSYALGISIIGLEVGFLYAYRAGWSVSTLSVVAAAALAVVLLFVGIFLYHETLSWNKIAGLLVCMGGLLLLNLK